MTRPLWEGRGARLPREFPWLNRSGRHGHGGVSRRSPQFSRCWREARRASGAAASTAGAAPAALDGPADGPAAGSGWTLSTTDTGTGYSPTFLGNGYFAGRIPAAGTGYSTTPIEAASQLAGLYAHAPGQVDQRANIPTWSTLAFSDGSGTYGQLPGSSADGQGTVSNYRQTLDLYKGLLTTQATWTSPAGHATDLSYQVMVDQALQRVAAVRLTFTPHWSGTADITGLFDGTSARLTTQSGKGYRSGEAYETVTTVGTGITAALASRLDVPRGAQTSEVDADVPQSVGEQARVNVNAGKAYTVTKYVGVASSQDSADPLAAARAAAATAAQRGYEGLLGGHEAAWAGLWRSDIQIAGDPALQLEVRASMFYLLESARAGVNWSASPAGLSSDGYSGHIFWDAETWMYPSLLATHPDIAVGMDAYRQERLAAAQANAAQTGFAGARFPWESALHGDEQTPPCCDEGAVEQHITADVALAQWQYYLATGDRGWLADKAWPVLKGAADFWASRAVPDPAGGLDINDVMGPDEHHDHVNNSVYTNVGAATTMRIATQAAQLIGQPADPRWTTVANGLRVLFDATRNVHPEFEGYSGDLVKQADVVMLQYPWGYAMPASVAQNDLDYYVPRTDPDGPSMTDSIHSIDTAALGTPGCADYYFLQRAVDPFMRGPFDQFSEARSGGAFTFTTGAGGFLQAFLYGFSGMRWRADGLRFDPTLPPQLHGVTLRQLSWQGRHFDVAIGPKSTRITLTSGATTPVDVGGQSYSLSRGATLTVPTRRPDLQPTTDLARCASVTADGTDPSYPATGAVDGSPITSWQATSAQASLVADLGQARTLAHATLSWDTSRATDYTLSVSTDGSTWRQVAAVAGASGAGPDQLTFPATSARYLRLSITATSTGKPAALTELSATA